MAAITEAFSSFPVNDIEEARAFYAGTLGLRVTNALPEGPGPLWVRVTDERGVLVYPKRDHVAADFTVLNLAVDDIAQAVDDLSSRGIAFQRLPEYEQDDRGIFHGPGHAIAWFTDPAGNGLSVVQLESEAASGVSRRSSPSRA